MSFAARVTTLREEGAYRVLAQAQELEARGHPVIHLEIGEPDQPTPEAVSEAGRQAIREGKTRYTAPRGIPELREAIAKDFGRRRGVQIEPDQVVVSPGTKPVMFLPAMALIEPGDEVIYPDPGFPSYRSVIALAGGVPRPVRLEERRGFSLDLDSLRDSISDRTKLIMLNSPSNPTGGVIPKEDLAELAELASRHDCWLISDEIYSQIVYQGESSPSLADYPEIRERLIIADGFSKRYAMTGWRLGYGIMPRPMAEKVSLMLTHTLGSTAQFTQIAGLEALRSLRRELGLLVQEYRRRRDALVEGLNAIPGVTCRLPAGAFYAFPNVTALGRSSQELTEHLLQTAKVAVLPGSDFGSGGEGYLRISYANSLENIQRGLARMQEALEC